MEGSGKDSLNKALVELERSFDLGKGFLVSLVSTDSDWSFVIKAHALVEAATTHLLANHLGTTSLADVLSQLPQSDPRAGRLAFLRELKLLDQDELRFLQKFSELRNRLVHNVHNTRFTFVDHLAALRNPDEEFAAWVAIGPKGPQLRASLRERALRRPKLELWSSVVFIVARCEISKIVARERQHQIDVALQLLEESADDLDDDKLEDS